MNSKQSTEHKPSDNAGVAFHPPLLLALVMIVGSLLRWLTPLDFLPRTVSSIIGPIVTAGSLGLFFWAAYTMRSGGASIPTNEPTTAIVVRGPFRLSRNPIYLAMLLLQIGVGVWANSFWFFGLAGIICNTSLARGLFHAKNGTWKANSGLSTYRIRPVYADGFREIKE